MVVACMLSFLATLVFVPDNALATNHGGWITADETWVKTGNPHNILRDVRVMPSVTLTILEGVKVSFNLGTTLYVDGDLVVTGTSTEPVRFSSLSFIPQRGDWGSIHFNSSSGGGQPSSTIDDAIIEYGSSGIYVYNRSLNIRDCTIRENFVGIDSNIGALLVETNSIYNNTYDGINWTGWNSVSSLASISGNNINNNGGNGINGSAGATVAIGANDISFNTYGIRFNDSTPATFQNNIFNNSEDGVYFLRSGNGTAISNNTIANNSKNGIWISTSSVKVDNNTMEDNGLNGTYGIYYSGTMENNTALSNPGSGIYLVTSSGAFLQYNNVTQNGIHGVYSYYSSHLILRENNITHNSPSGLCPPSCGYYGIYAYYGSTLQIDHNRIENNTVRGIRLNYVTQTNVTDNTISNHDCSLAFGIRATGGRVNILKNVMIGNNYSHIAIEDYQDSSRVENNTIVGIGTGIALYDSGSSIMIANNSISGLVRGMLLVNSSARVFNNQIWNLTGIAIQLEADSNEDVFNNTITNAQGGISLDVESSEVGSPHIHNNTITAGSNSQAGITVVGQGTATPTIKYNTITNHTTLTGYGILIYGSNAHPEIVNNTIRNNYYGIHLQNGANATIHGCNIFDNSPYGAINWDNTVKVNATENWWGDSSGPTHLDNPGGSGDRVSNDIKFDPWLATPAF
jgi:parallel beta-helix repeat protein